MIPVLDGVELELHGFVDVGWFDVQGNGSSFRPARTKADGTWSYTGDPWASTINSQGDPADLGNTFDNLERHDPIASGGRPTFLVNTVELGTKLKSAHVDAEAALWVEPRNGFLGDLGDQISLDRAFFTWHPGEQRGFELNVGKLESVFGIEWYDRLAPERDGITPSFVARYTTGTPVGVGAHVDAGDHVAIEAQVTNGGTTTERFGHVENEIDVNGVPTGTLHLEVVPFDGRQLKLGVSGQAGAQDGAVEVIPMWQLGADLSIDSRIGEFLFFIRGEAMVSDQNQGRSDVEQLEAIGWYLQVWAQPWKWPLAPLVRVDQRDATLEVPFVPDDVSSARVVHNEYDSNVLRLTTAVRFDLSFNVVLKAEVSHLWELTGEPIADDVITTSAVFRW